MKLIELKLETEEGRLTCFTIWVLGLTRNRQETGFAKVLIFTFTFSLFLQKFYLFIYYCCYYCCHGYGVGGVMGGILVDNVGILAVIIV